MKNLSLKEVRLLGETWDLWSHLSPWSFPSNFVSLSWYLLQTVWYHSCLYLYAHFCHSVGSETRSHVFRFCIPFRLQEKELAFIECLLYTKHFSLFYIFVTHNYFVKAVLLFSFNKLGHWNLEKFHKFLTAAQQLSMILKHTFSPCTLLHTHSIHFCWRETNITIV